LPAGQFNLVPVVANHNNFGANGIGRARLADSFFSFHFEDFVVPLLLNLIVIRAAIGHP
jgi:hypothetical protein